MNLFIDVLCAAVHSLLLTADCCCAVMLKAEKTDTVLDLCRCDREGKRDGGFARSERLKSYSKQITQPIVSRIFTVPWVPFPFFGSGVVSGKNYNLFSFMHFVKYLC